MSYRDAFRDIVKRRLENRPAMMEQWVKHEKYGNLPWINDLCNRGQGPFTTKEATLCYCMAYMHGHYEAAKIVLEGFADQLDASSRVAMLDVGCGPMTAALALSDLFTKGYGKPVALNYIGIDTSERMLKFAKKFSERDDCFSTSESDYRRFVDGCGAISDRRISKFLKGATHIVVTFNYVLAQSSLNLATVDELAELTVRIAAAAGKTPVWIAYANSTYPTSYFQYFAHRCGKLGATLAKSTAIPRSLPLAQHRLAEGVTEVVSDSGKTNFEYLLTRIEVK